MNPADPFAELSFADIASLYFVLVDTVGKDEAFANEVAKEIARRIMSYRQAWSAAHPAQTLPPIPPPPPDDVPPPPPPEE